MARITPQQIESARQAFRDGFSIPEACRIAKMSKASFNKYLGKEVKTWVEEHTQAKARRVNLVMTDELIPDDNKIMLDTQFEQDRLAAQELDNKAAISKLSYDEFVSYVEFELNNCADDIVYLKELYYQLKQDAADEYRKVIKLRELYESRLNRIGKSKPDTSSLDRKCTNFDAIEQTITEYSSKFRIEIPVPKAYRGRWKTDTGKRIKEHIVYWISANYLKRSHSEPIKLTRLTEPELDDWLKLL